MSQVVEQTVEQFFDTHFQATTSIRRDLMMNLKKILEESPLSEADRYASFTAVAQSLHNSPMKEFAVENLKRLDFNAEQIQECIENAAIMGMLNTYYKFKSYLPEAASPDYARAGLRMQSLMKPLNGKERFEMMAFAVSIVNGCPSCIASHEKALRDLNVEPEKIHDLARMAATCKGLASL